MRWAIAQRGRLLDGLADVALLLVQDLELQELLLLLQEAHVGRVQGSPVAGVLLLVGWDVLVVLELLHARLGVFAAFLASVFLTAARPGLALLDKNRPSDRRGHGSEGLQDRQMLVLLLCGAAKVG